MLLQKPYFHVYQVTQVEQRIINIFCQYRPKNPYFAWIRSHTCQAQNIGKIKQKEPY